MVLRTVQASAWWSVPGLLLVAYLLKSAAVVVGSTWTWSTMQTVLDDWQKFVFKKPSPLHEHRITLYRHVRFLFPTPRRWRLFSWKQGRWPWSGWLVPMMRSGHVNKRTNAIFFAPDDGKLAEGVVGQTWARNAILEIKDLPAINTSSTDADVESYASRTWVPADFIRQRLKAGQQCASSFLATPVERKKKIWGVVIMDSSAPKGIRPASVVRLASHALVIGKLLEKG